MLDALVNFAVMNIVFIVIAVIVGAYVLIRTIANARSASTQLDEHMHAQLIAIERERAASDRGTDIHARA